MHLWTHKKLEIGYNGKSIVDVNLTSDGKVELKKDAKIHFTFEVVWKESNVPFVDRFDKYLDPNFFQHRVSLKLMLSIHRELEQMEAKVNLLGSTEGLELVILLNRQLRSIINCTNVFGDFFYELTQLLSSKFFGKSFH